MWLYQGMRKFVLVILPDFNNSGLINKNITN